MKIFLAFMFGVMLCSIWEHRGGPRWRTSYVVIACAVVAISFTSLRFA